MPFVLRGKQWSNRLPAVKKQFVIFSWWKTQSETVTVKQREASLLWTTQNIRNKSYQLTNIIATKQTLHIQLLSYMIYLRTPECGKHWTKMWWIVRPPPPGLAPVHTVKSAQLHCIGAQNSSACYFQLYRMINVAFLSIAHSLHVSIKTCFYDEIARHDNSRWGSDC